MPELSLDALASERTGVAVRRLEIRRASPTGQLSDEQRRNLKRVLWALPLDPQNNTILSVRLASNEEDDEWYVAWERQRAGISQNSYVREKSQEMGGMLGLEATLSSLWAQHGADEIATMLFAEYDLTGYVSQLFTSRNETLEPQKWGVQNTGSFWKIKGAPQLIAASFAKDERRDTLGVVGIGAFRVGGWPSVTVLETQLWQDLQQVCQRGPQ
jgi:hypothetical protein